MSHITTLFQGIAMLLFFVAAARALTIRRPCFQRMTIGVLFSFLGLLGLISLFNFLRTADITGVMEPYEGYAEIILFPLALFVIYSVRTDLASQRLALLQEDERMRAVLLDSVGDSVFLHRDDGRIVYANRNAWLTRGYTEEELLSIGADDLTPPSHGEKTKMSFPSTGSAGAVTFETIHSRKDGTVFPVEVIARRFSYKGNESVLSVARDLTERKRLDKEQQELNARLRQAQKMESLGTLAGGIAHDFNNILFPIMGYSDLLADQFSAGSPQHDSLVKIGKAAERGRDIVRQLLSYSRGCKEEESVRPVFLQRVLKEVLALAGEVLPSSVSLETHLSSAPPVLSTESQMHRVCLNLLTNAYQAMEGRPGTVRVFLGEAPLPQGKGDGPSWAFLKVQDTGRGMTKEEQERIFDPYYTTKKDRGGTGLGLSVVDGIVRDAGGSITVKSEPGAGTELTVLLPGVVEEKARKHKTDVTLIDETGKLLVVDDEQVVAGYLKEVLESEGFEVTAFSDSEKAAEAFERDPQSFDLVLSDFTMPSVTGDELARRVRALRGDIPFLMCSGYSGQMTKQEMEELGIGGFLLKPLRRSELLGAVKLALAGRKRRS